MNRFPMSFLHSIKLVLAPPHPAGRPFLLGGGAATAALLVPTRTTRALGGVAGLFTLFCLYFFRDPVRVPPDLPGAVVAPADGRIVSVERAVPPPELDLGPEPRWRVAIFLSVLNVHVNRAPAAGEIARIRYHPGRFVNASLDKASEQNERNALALRLPDGQFLAVVQIAGLIARRILCDVREGDRVAIGDRFGIIRFGSRTDLYLPPDVEPIVRVGQSTVGGETVLARL